MSTVILGGGIIGLSTAYYLSQSHSQPSQIHIIDSSSTLLTSASGYAGGFLALDWFSPPVAELGALSFRLHRELAEKHDGQRRWGYAGSHVYSLSVDDRGMAKGKKVRGEDWLLEGTSRAAVVGANTSGANLGVEGAERGEALNDDGTPAWITPQVGGSVDTISGPDECAQVEPRELCEFLVQECRSRGVQVHLSTKAVGIMKDDNGELKALKLQSTQSGPAKTWELNCSSLLLTAGAWTPRVFQTLFPQSSLKIPIDPLAGHSILVKSPRYKQPFVNTSRRNTGLEHQCYAIYCAPGLHWSYAPEAFARLARGGETEIWLGGLNDSSLQLPEYAEDVKAMIDKTSMQELRKTTVQLTGLSKEGDHLHEDDLETIREGLCFRPVSRRGTPLVSRLPDNQIGGLKTSGNGGVYIASGHGPWGISLSLGTGLVMSELMLGKQTSADVRGLSLR